MIHNYKFINNVINIYYAILKIDYKFIQMNIYNKVIQYYLNIN